MIFKAQLEAYPHNRVIDTAYPINQIFNDQILDNKLTDSARRLVKPEDEATWAHILVMSTL